MENNLLYRDCKAYHHNQSLYEKKIADIDAIYNQVYTRSMDMEKLLELLEKEKEEISLRKEEIENDYELLKERIEYMKKEMELQENQFALFAKKFHSQNSMIA